MSPRPLHSAQTELEALAERALAVVAATVAGPAQATAWWEHGALATDGEVGRAVAAGVDLTVVAAGRHATVATERVDDEGLATAAYSAAALARAGVDAAAGGLGEDAPGIGTGRSARAHAGDDPAVPRLDPVHLPRRAYGSTLDWQTGAARTAIAATSGIRAFERRSHVALLAIAREGERTVALTVAAPGPGGVDAEALAREARALAVAAHADRTPEAAAPGEPTVVLGPDAVAGVLAMLRDELAADEGREAHGRDLAARTGERIAAPAVNLSDSPRYPTGLPRTYDRRGRAYEPMPLIQDGVMHALAPFPPRHLVLVGGGAEGIPALLAPVADGLFVAGLGPDGSATGVSHVRDGRLAAPAPDLRVAVDPVAVLAGVAALTARQRTIPALFGPAREIGATVVPALRTVRGIRVLPA